MMLSLQKFCHILIMGGILYVYTGTSIVILLAEWIWGKTFHDFNIKNICRITTLKYALKTSEKDIWQYTNKKIL